MKTTFHNRYLKKLAHKEPVVIAEIGLNHNGNLTEAIELIHRAADSGADLVKFQIINAELLYSVYTRSLINNQPPQHDDSMITFFKRFELTQSDYVKLQQTAGEDGVVFFASCFDLPSFAMLDQLQVPLYKIASSEITNVPLIKNIAATGKPVVCSTGISHSYEIEYAIKLLQGGGVNNIVLLHCISLYPVPPHAVNLLRIQHLQQKFGLPVGFSDHANDNRASMMAVASGALVFEKHFKLFDDHDCIDKDVSLSPEAFKRYVDDIHMAYTMMGDGAIDYHDAEAGVARSARRSIFAAQNIQKGTIVTEEHLTLKRPGVGLSPLYLDKIVGKKVKRDIIKDMPLCENDMD